MLRSSWSSSVYPRPYPYLTASFVTIEREKKKYICIYNIYKESERAREREREREREKEREREREEERERQKKREIEIDK